MSFFGLYNGGYLNFNPFMYTRGVAFGANHPSFINNGSNFVNNPLSNNSGGPINYFTGKPVYGSVQQNITPLNTVSGIQNTQINQQSDTFIPQNNSINNGELDTLLTNAKNKQGIIGKTIDSFKSSTGLGLSSKKCQRYIDDYKNGKMTYSEVLEKINKYDYKQTSSTNLISSLISGSIGILAASLVIPTGGLSLGALAAASGACALSKVSIKTIDRMTNNVQKDALNPKQLAKDTLQGAIDGFATASVMGMGKNVLAGASTLKETIKLGTLNGFKAGAISGAIMGAGNYTVECATEKDEKFEGDKLIVNTVTSSLAGGITGSLLGGIFSFLGFKKPSAGNSVNAQQNTNSNTTNTSMTNPATSSRNTTSQTSTNNSTVNTSGQNNTAIEPQTSKQEPINNSTISAPTDSKVVKPNPSSNDETLLHNLPKPKDNTILPKDDAILPKPKDNTKLAKDDAVLTKDETILPKDSAILAKETPEHPTPKQEPINNKISAPTDSEVVKPNPSSNDETLLHNLPKPKDNTKLPKDDAILPKPKDNTKLSKDDAILTKETPEPPTPKQEPINNSTVNASGQNNASMEPPTPKQEPINNDICKSTQNKNTETILPTETKDNYTMPENSGAEPSYDKEPLIINDALTPNKPEAEAKMPTYSLENGMSNLIYDVKNPKLTNDVQAKTLKKGFSGFISKVFNK